MHSDVYIISRVPKYFSFRSQFCTQYLKYVSGVCVNLDQHLVVADNKLCQIFIFQVNGKLISKFGKRGTGPSQLAGPHYVAVNRNNEILVTDFYNHCVKVCSLDF